MTQFVRRRTFRFGGMVLFGLLISSPAFAQATYDPDCNDPDAADLNCTEPTRALVLEAQADGYPYYIGHAEPTVLFFSGAGASGNNMQYKIRLPSTDPSPTQNGSSVANFELYSTFW